MWSEVLNELNDWQIRYDSKGWVKPGYTLWHQHPNLRDGVCWNHVSYQGATTTGFTDPMRVSCELCEERPPKPIMDACYLMGVVF